MSERESRLCFGLPDGLLLRAEFLASSLQLVGCDLAFGLELLSLRGPRRLLILKLQSMGRELFAFDRQLFRGSVLFALGFPALATANLVDRPISTLP